LGWNPGPGGKLRQKTLQNTLGVRLGKKKNNPKKFKFHNGKLLKKKRGGGFPAGEKLGVWRGRPRGGNLGKKTLRVGEKGLYWRVFPVFPPGGPAFYGGGLPPSVTFSAFQKKNTIQKKNWRATGGEGFREKKPNRKPGSFRQNKKLGRGPSKLGGAPLPVKQQKKTYSPYPFFSFFPPFPGGWLLGETGGGIKFLKQGGRGVAEGLGKKKKKGGGGGREFLGKNFRFT